MKYVILGPTASGKTAYAIALAKQINGAVISADSRTLYAGMNSGTAKPKEAWKDTPHAIEVPDLVDSIPHYLLNISSLDTPYTLSHWLSAAKKVIALIEAQGQIPIITGGTMLYIDALTDGYDIPVIEPNKKLRFELEQTSAEELYKELILKDPDAASFIEKHNTRRIIRALEVIEATGKPFSSLRTKRKSDDTFTKIGIFSGWDTLKENITKRAHDMMKEGLAEEKETLAVQFPTSPLLRTMNYTEHSVEEMVQSNMRYAHRQVSWWKRRNDIGWICLSEQRGTQ